MNKITICGNIVEKPELKQTNNGLSTCTLKVAVQRRMAKEGQQTADFFNCKVWKVQAENCCKYLDKGRKVLISGSMHIDSFKDKDGNAKQSAYVMVDDVEFLPQSDHNTNTASASKQLIEESIDVEDDLPF